jgi:Conserved protein/domain typically associated with flavoprotein oxygenases, DIM6/NTAB family
MGKQTWKAGNMLYPLPAVMVSVRGKNGEDNIITVAWAGTVCTNPPMVSISVRPERYSYQMIKESGAFVINLTTEDLCYATDYCGVRSGRDVDKFKEMKLTKVEAEEISAPMIGESPVNIECKVEQVLELGSHHMFLAKVVAVHADEAYMDERGRFDLNRAKPIVYSHGEYFGIGKKQGTFGWSVKKKSKTPNIKTKTAANLYFLKNQHAKFYSTFGKNIQNRQKYWVNIRKRYKIMIY